MGSLTALKRPLYAPAPSSAAGTRPPSMNQEIMMLRTLFAALAAVALFASQPARACDDCKDCPKHKVAAAEKAEKKEAKPAACSCHGEGKECACPPGKCSCGH